MLIIPAIFITCDIHALQICFMVRKTSQNGIYAKCCSSNIGQIFKIRKNEFEKFESKTLFMTYKL